MLVVSFCVECCPEKGKYRKRELHTAQAFEILACLFYVLFAEMCLI